MTNPAPTEPLAEAACTPCRGGVPVLAAAEAQAMLGQLATSWRISDDGSWLERDYTFKNFAAALTYANAVGLIAENEGHHPDISLGWGYVKLRLQTHAIGGLHRNDFILAAKIDRIPAA